MIADSDAQAVIQRWWLARCFRKVSRQSRECLCQWCKFIVGNRTDRLISGYSIKVFGLIFQPEFCNI